jgi:hypothetical protein
MGHDLTALLRGHEAAARPRGSVAKRLELMPAVGRLGRGDEVPAGTVENSAVQCCGHRGDRDHHIIPATANVQHDRVDGIVAANVQTDACQVK